MLYTINELPTYKEVCEGLKYSQDTVTESNDKDAVIADAEDYFCQESMDDGEYGDGEKEVYLITHNDNGDIIAEDVIKLTWFSDDYNEYAEHNTLWGAL